MKLNNLEYVYPNQLVAKEPSKPKRVMWVAGDPTEMTLQEMMAHLKAGDVVVINNTKVAKRRIHGHCENGDLEVLFTQKLNDLEWEVLCPASRIKKDELVKLPGGVTLEFVARGLPQVVRTNEKLDERYFEANGEMPLPPYIQKARQERHARPEDHLWYQTDWARHIGSQAAPTASLHFTNDDIEKLQARGVVVQQLTLHVGLGTFLPVKTENLEDHKMHSEYVHIPNSTLAAIKKAQQSNNKVWAMGTTVARALESVDKLTKTDGGIEGNTDLFITPGFEFKTVDYLMTNFHQPKSTLLALVAAFAGLDKVMSSYNWAIKKRFKLFSYGDLTVWQKKK